MTANEAFDKCVHGPWKTVGLDVQYRIEREGSLTLVFFQCTKSWVDWIIDFLVFPFVLLFSFKNTKLHTGYWAAFSSALPELSRDLNANGAFVTGARVMIFGYSYGGGVAKVLHRWLRDWFDIGVRTYTFGAPRVFWGKLSDEAIRATRDITNFRVRGDVVTHYMPRISGYQDDGFIVEIGDPSGLSWKKHRTEEYRKNLVGYIIGTEDNTK